MNIEEYKNTQLKAVLSKGLDKTLTISRETTSCYANLNQTLNQTFSWVWVSYSLSPLPGCCGVVVSHNAYVSCNVEGYGLGDYFHKERLGLMKDLGYSCSLCTVTGQNEKQKHILTKNGWNKVDEFVNSRTKNTVEIWTKHL